jgi:hypothetical protein
MIVCKVFCKDHGLKKDDLLGVLAERGKGSFSAGW